jgi:hypothetical protein
LLLLNFARNIVNSGSATVPNSTIDAQIHAQERVSRLLRWISLYLRGKSGRTRAALLVLFSYMANLVILGFLTVAFWALAIKLYSAPSHVNLSDALLASASHVIPGVPDAEGIKVSAGIQAGISLTAWAIFVLYAGPVASVFPMLQERYTREVAQHYTTLRAVRAALYRTKDDLRRLLGGTVATTEDSNAVSPLPTNTRPGNGAT